MKDAHKKSTQEIIQIIVSFMRRAGLTFFMAEREGIKKVINLELKKRNLKFKDLKIESILIQILIIIKEMEAIEKIIPSEKKINEKILKRQVKNGEISFSETTRMAIKLLNQERGKIPLPNNKNNVINFSEIKKRGKAATLNF